MPTWLMAFPDSPILSALILLLALVIAMYGARSPAHRLIQGTAKAITQGCKLTSEAIRGVQNRLTDRTREVLLSEGLREAERQIDQEFQRVTASVERDLGGYPALHRMLADQVQRIDAVQKDPKKTAMFVVGLVAAAAVTTYGFSRAVHDYGVICDYFRPEDRQCYVSSNDPD